MRGFFGREKTPTVREIRDQPEARKRGFRIEFGDKEFDFVEFQSCEPSDTTVLRFPALAIDAEKEAEGLHYSMEQKYTTLALKDYGKEYSRDSVKEAIRRAIHESGRTNVVLHGTSFGAGIVYDLISDPSDPGFAEANNIRGAILETPALGKSHFNKRIRSVPDSILISSGMKFSKIVSHISDPGVVGYRESGRALDPSMLAELFREKTAGRKIYIPIHAVFAEDDHLIDNEQTLQTLQSQCSDLRFQRVPSRGKSLRHQIDYGNIWSQERAVVDRFVEGSN